MRQWTGSSNRHEEELQHPCSVQRFAITAGEITLIVMLR